MKSKQQAFLTVDLGFGDAGKGSIVDFLVRRHEAHTVIRFNGGAQAGHRVVAYGNDGAQYDHVFAQFGSGSFAGAATHLSRFVLLDPLAMSAEAAHLRELAQLTALPTLPSDPFLCTTIDCRARVVTPYQRAVNRLRELARGHDRHGSCGMGIGETMADWLAHGEAVLFAGDLADRDRLRRKLTFLRTVNRAKIAAIQAELPNSTAVVDELAGLFDDDEWLIEHYQSFAGMAQIVPVDYLTTLLQQPGNVVFEAAQGVLLDEWRGFHPYTTWSTTTLANAETLLAEAQYRGEITRIGITRAYATRHGAGPFVSEDAVLTAALPDACNHNGAWQQGFRVGWLDLVMLRYALAVTGRLDYLALTCLDRLANRSDLKLCTHYQHSNGQPLNALAQSPHAHDLAQQEQLTAQLAQCQPQFTQLEDIRALPVALTTALGLPIGIYSYGPTAEEKRFCLSAEEW